MAAKALLALAVLGAVLVGLLLPTPHVSEAGPAQSSQFATLEVARP